MPTRSVEIKDRTFYPFVPLISHLRCQLHPKGKPYSLPPLEEGALQAEAAVKRMRGMNRDMVGDDAHIVLHDFAETKDRTAG